MKKRTVLRIKLILLIAFFVGIDQWTKKLAETRLKPKTEDVTLIKHFLALNYLEGGNQGAAWGIFSGKIMFLILFSIVILALLIIFIRNINDRIEVNYSLKNTKLYFLEFFIALLIAGAVGNLIDRFLYGSVVDFICFRFMEFPTFNVADIYVTVSCIAIFTICFFKIQDDEFNSIFTLKRKNNHE